MLLLPDDTLVEECCDVSIFLADFIESGGVMINEFGITNVDVVLLFYSVRLML
jgi:hypothetical protein